MVGKDLSVLSRADKGSSLDTTFRKSKCQKFLKWRHSTEIKFRGFAAWEAVKLALEAHTALGKASEALRLSLDWDKQCSGLEEEWVLEFSGKNNFIHELVTGGELVCAVGMGRRKEGRRV